MEHAKATAMCVELALGGVEADIEKELGASTGVVADTLRRVLDRVRERRQCVSDLASGEFTVKEMIERNAL
jgi:hypothetical protein